MRGYLLDTHIFLWAITLDPRLGPSTATIPRDSANALSISLASGWEVAIKVGLGKLEVDRPLLQLLGPSLTERGITLLPITLGDVDAYAKLPMPTSGHRDPFDRMLVVQAAERGLTLLTSDPTLVAYGTFVQLV